MCAESTGNRIGTGRAGDTGDGIYKEPASGETSDNKCSQDRLNTEIIALEMYAISDN